MRRLRDYCRFVAWQAGLGYLLLWAVTFWTLDEGASVFGKSGVCFPDEAKVLFYWVCDPASPLTILASIANAALTATVWAPVYLAAARRHHHRRTDHRAAPDRLAARLVRAHPAAGDGARPAPPGRVGPRAGDAGHLGRAAGRRRSRRTVAAATAAVVAPQGQAARRIRAQKAGD